MTLFDQILDLIGQPPGSLVYHILALAAVQFALMIALGQWLRDRDSGTARLTVGVAILFIARALLLIAALLVMSGQIPGNVVLPPVERAVDTITVLGLFWIFVTMDDPAILRRNFGADMIAGVLLGIIAVGFLGTYYYWYSSVSRNLLFNGLWLDFAWAVAQIASAVIGLLWMLTRIKYVYDPLLKGVILLALAGAAGLHLARTPFGDVAVAMRVGQIIAMPLLTAVAYRHVVERLLHWDEFEPTRQPATDPGRAFITPPSSMPPVVVPPPAQVAPPRRIEPATPAPRPEDEDREAVGATARRPPPDRPVDVGSPSRPASLPAEPPVLEVVETLRGLFNSLEQSQVVREAARVVATALRADICALAVIDESSGEAGVIGGYDNITQAHLPQAVLSLSNHPTIVNALGRLRQMRLTTQRNSKELQDFYTNLLISHLGPAYIQPLVDGEERIGVLVVGSPYSERFLSHDERNLLDRLAPLVTAAMLNAEAFELARSETDKIASEEGARLASLADELTGIRIEYESAQRQIEEMKAYIRDMHRQLEAAPKSDPDAIARLQLEIERLQLEVDEAEKLRLRYEELQANHAAAVGELEELKESSRELERRAAAAPGDDRIARLEAEINRLRETADSRSRSTEIMDRAAFERQLEDTRLAAQTEIASLRTRLTQASITQQEVTFLQEQLASKAREAIALQTRLTEAQAVAEALRDQLGRSPGSAYETFHERIAAQSGEIATLRSQLADLQSRTNLSPDALRAQQEVEQIDRQAMAQLEGQLAERAALVDALDKQLAEKNRAVAVLREHMNEVESSLRNLEYQLSSKTGEISSLQVSLADTRRQAQERIADLERQIARGESTDSDEAHRARVEALEAELAEKAAAIRVLETQLYSTTDSMRQLELQLSATNRAVDAAISDARQDDSHNEVIASIAQELRTPMSSIMGYTELLLRESVGILGALQRKFLQRVKANTERMGVLLDDLIRITALDTGRLELQPESIDVTYAIEEVIMNVASQYREKGLVLRMTLDENLPRLVADRPTFLQVMGHLLTNAALASPVEGEVQLLVTTRRDLVPAYGDEEEVDCLYVKVEDSGSGVAPEDYERVFSRHYRADNPLIEGLGDTGVSLSLAKSLIDAHGGRLWLGSEKGMGTTFYMLLPLHSAEQSEAA